MLLCAVLALVALVAVVGITPTRSAVFNPARCSFSAH
jgi:hypothetical protein